MLSIFPPHKNTFNVIFKIFIVYMFPMFPFVGLRSISNRGRLIVMTSLFISIPALANMST